MTTKAHNLDIHMYSLQELLELFDLPLEPTMLQMKNAKKKVLMMHPDKSKLPAEYFLFYKKALDVVAQFFNNQQKQHTELTEENTTYVAADTDKQIQSQVNSSIKKMGDKEFRQKFNKLFDENMSKKIDKSKNEWFSKDAPIYETSEQVNANNMGKVFEKIKETQVGMVRYQGVQTMFMNPSSGNKLYDDEDGDAYVETDPFSKLKYDDLRKVHKDQTVFSVSERDIHNVPRYQSVDHIMQARGNQKLAPLEKQQAEHMLKQQDQSMRHQLMEKEYAEKLRTMQYAEKNKSILSGFLRIQN